MHFQHNTEREQIFEGYFKCFNQTKLIHLSKVCNGLIDCFYGSDEIFCQSDSKVYQNCKTKNLKWLICNFDGKIQDRNNRFLNLEEKLKQFKKLTINGDDIKFHLKKSLNLIYLSIKYNQNFLLNKNIEQNFPNIIYLSIQNSNLIDNSPIFKYKLKLLIYLDVSSNFITNLEFLSKISCLNLKILKISKTKVKYLTKFNFKKCKNLIQFEMKFCDINLIEESSFVLIQNFQLLDIRYSKISIKNFMKLINSYKSLNHVKTLRDDFCCLIQHFFKKFDITCLENTVNFSEKCLFFYENFFIQIIYLIFGFFGFLANLLSIFTLRDTNSSKNYKILMNFSNLIVSIILLYFSIIHFYYGSKFLSESESYLEYIHCQLIGEIMIISILMSVISNFLLTTERYLAIKKPFLKSILTTKSLFLSFSITTSVIVLTTILFLLNQLKLNNNKICINVYWDKNEIENNLFHFFILYFLSPILNFLINFMYLSIIVLMKNTEKHQTLYKNQTKKANLKMSLYFSILTNFLSFFTFFILGFL